MADHEGETSGAQREKKRRLIAELAPSPHLTAADLDGDTIVTIKGDGREHVGVKQELRGVLYFEEFERGMVVNVTNRTLIKAATGCLYVDELIGKRITLYQSEATLEGKVVPCIRVRGTAPSEKALKLHEQERASA